MNELSKTFQFQTNEVRVVEIDGEPWFVAKDVCDILELSNSRMAVESIEEDEKGVSKVYTRGGEQELIIISESGLYQLVFRSNKPNAKQFRQFVTKTVLPEIRKAGSFLSAEDRLKIEVFNIQNRKKIASAEAKLHIAKLCGDMQSYASLRHLSYAEVRRTVQGFTFNERVCKALKNDFDIDIRSMHTGERDFEALADTSNKKIA